MNFLKIIEIENSKQKSNPKEAKAIVEKKKEIAEITYM
jgi:hypothetical protein